MPRPRTSTATPTPVTCRYCQSGDVDQDSCTCLDCGTVMPGRWTFAAIAEPMRAYPRNEVAVNGMLLRFHGPGGPLL